MAPRTSEPREDIVGDRTALIGIGFIAVCLACVVFGGLRLVDELITGRLTPWWGNVSGAIALGVLYAWWRGDRLARSSYAVHGIAAIATIALVVPSAYGMTSSKWWLALVGFSVLLMGRRAEARVWAVITLILLPLTALFEAQITVTNAAGEPPIERAAAALCFLAILLGMTLAFRRAADRRARQLDEMAQSLERANQVKRDFLATMSHELRTPLNAVIGMSALLGDTALSPEQRERLGVIQASGEALLTLIGDILDVSKIEAGKLEVESAPVDVMRIVEESLDFVAATAETKGLEIGCVVAESCPTAILSDPTRVRQILVNLLGNAVKFTEQGSVVVRVDAKPTDRGRVELAFAVSDTGIGIARGALDRLFVPFSQADTATTRKYGGTGLGLAICKSLSEMLGGGIGAESAVGKGSTFRFTIVGEAVAQEPLRVKGAHAGARVIVVSDVTLARDLLASKVARLGFEVIPHATPAAAEEDLRAGKGDVVIFDARQPPEDATKRLAPFREAREGVPILVLVPPRRGSAARVDAMLRVAFATKPIKAPRLLETLEALLVGDRAPPREVSGVDLAPSSTGDGRPRTALVVDDNEINRRVALEIVRRLGLVARAVESGAKAIEAIRAERFDYVLMDVQMPDMDGFEATRRILEGSRSPKPRIVAMTASALPGDRERCLAAGMSDYVTKPVRPAALAAALDRTYDAGRDATLGEGSSITDVLDARVLEDLRMLEERSGAPLLSELAATFRSDVPLRLEELREAVRTGDLDRVCALAHRLRGSCGAIGANRVFLTATELETRARTVKTPELETMAARLASDVTRALDAFERVIEHTKRDDPDRGPE